MGNREIDDAVILKLDFAHSSNSVVNLEFIFALEEYPAFLVTEILKDDGFAVFVNYEMTNSNKARPPGTEVPIISPGA